MTFTHNDFVKSLSRKTNNGKGKQKVFGLYFSNIMYVYVTRKVKTNICFF